MDKPTILWVDDEIDLLKPHIIFLKDKGYDVVTSNNGHEALEIVKQKVLDIVFLDEQMPGLSGIETLLQLKAISPIPFFADESCRTEDEVKKSADGFHGINIKWPNDVYVGLKKIAGTLIECDIKGNSIEHVIAGIGLNLNQERFYSDAPNPVSVKNLIHTDISVSSSLESVLYYIGLRYRQLKEKLYDRINSDYLENLLFYKSFHQYLSKGNRFNGAIADVDSFGKLQILTDEGELKSFEMKDICFIL